MTEESAPSLQRLIDRVQEKVHAGRDPEQVRAVLEEMLRSPDWLEPRLQELGRSDSATYPLYDAPDGSVCMVSLIIRPGVTLGVHDHGAWAVLGVYNGRIKETWYRRLDDGNTPGVARLQPERTFIHERGAAGLLPDGQIHTATGLGDIPAVTIQIYGTSLAKQGRTKFDLERNREEPYVAHYMDPGPAKAT